ncbi:Short-chain-fatty-acid--CoA ligase [compost metagenome]
MPDNKFGEEICAWIRLKEDHALDEDAVKVFCRGSIAHYKIPRYIRFVTSFPMTVSGKVQKFSMREAMIKELGISEIKTA